MKKILIYLCIIGILIGLTALFQFCGYTLYLKDYLFMVLIGLLSIIFLYFKIAGLKKENPFLNIFFMYIAFFLKIVCFLILYLVFYLKTERTFLGFFILFTHYLVYNVLEIILLKKVKI